jgi:signal transduction histidine kinase/ActR/RegA family two-component response regulator
LDDGKGGLLARLSLQSKVLLATTLSVLLISGLLSVGVFQTFSHSFRNVEEQSILETNERLTRALSFQVSSIERSCKDYAWWTETHHYIQQPNATYIEANLNETALENLRLSHFCLFNREGLLVIGNSKGKLVQTGQAEAKDLETLFSPCTRETAKVPATGTHGVLAGPDGPILYACMAVFEDEGKGVSNGFLVQARQFDVEALDELRALCNLPLRLVPPQPARAGGPEQAARAWTIQDDHIRLSHALIDNRGQPVGSLETTLERQIQRQAQTAMRILTAGILVISLFAGAMTLWLMRWLVTGRLAALQRELHRIGGRTDASARIEISGTDEIADLAADINRMVAAIRSSEERQLQAHEESLQLQDQLRQSQKMEVIGTMAGGLAHDFNNTLNSILGSADLLQFELPASHPAQEHIRRIEKVGMSASGIVRQLLAVSRRQALKQEVLSLDSVIRESLDLIRASLPKRIETAYQAETAVDSIMGDRMQLQQVLINLATNASHAMATTENPRLLLALSSANLPDRLHPETAKLTPGNYLRLVVSDNGSGMSEETLAHIFEPFYTTKPSGSGTGLGLAVVHGIITKHNGSIGLSSRPGAGTRFTIHLPLATVAPEIRPGEQQRTSDQRPLSVLMVDDDRLVLDTLATGLRRSHQEVHATSNTEEALRLLSDLSVQIDILVTDQLMPGMTGLDLGIRAREFRPDLPMVLISGFTANVEDEVIHERGFARIVMKPMTPEQLLECIRETVTTRR